jgi:MSHA pilin protein MshC
MPNRYRDRLCRIRGFTLIELVMIIVIVSVLGVLAVTRYQPTEITVSIEADHLARDIRHMQMLAMTWGQTLRFTIFPGNNGYRVTCASGIAVAPCNGAAAVIDPATGALFETPVPPGLNGVAVAGAAFDVDALGRPGTWTAGAPPTFTLAIAVPAANFILTSGGEASTVSVARLTGFVTVVH